MAARNWALGLAIGAVLAAGVPATALAAGAAAAAGPGTTAPAAAALRAPLPGGLGPCVGSACPDPYPPLGSDGVLKGRDDGINVFVGGDFLVRERASEAEGRIVVLGSFDQDKAAGFDSRYNVGVVGAGSLVPPPAGADFLTTGGNVTVADGERLLADTGVVRHAGTLTGVVTGTRVRDTAAVRPYAGLRDRLTAASRCYARPDGRNLRPATGTVADNGHETVFTGDDTSPLQVFNVDADLAGRTGAQQGVRFTRIPAGATVLVNVLGTTRTVNTYSGGIADTDPLNAYRERLLWNFPDATTVHLAGTGQFQGSFLMGQQSSMTTVTLPGINGRFFTTGSVTHTSARSGGGGQEFHAYPFTGDLPACDEPVPVTGRVAVRKVDSLRGTFLPGATFQLWREANGVAGLQVDGTARDELVRGSCVTDAGGLCEGVVPVGTYHWRETVPPNGYELPEQPVATVVLTEQNAAAGVTVTVPNDREVSGHRIRLLKKDRKSGQPLRGVVFELWRETNGTAGLQTKGGTADLLAHPGCATDTEGTCDFEGLEEGAYYLRETAAPEDYALPPNRVTGPLRLDANTPGGALEVTLHNDRDHQGKDGDEDKEKGKDKDKGEKDKGRDEEHPGEDEHGNEAKQPPGEDADGGEDEGGEQSDGREWDQGGLPGLDVPELGWPH
ncbi:choice-of-anchor A family protein [Streptomyces sp. NPDC101206]|uniref:choice-of-anchor A family protein n=1 Tax=Streptomyces sp. NPDC101206 TaxID=3366128 RepID=UPI00381985BE